MSILHFFKSLISLPVILSLILLIAVLLWYKGKKIGKILFILVLIKLWFLSTPFGAYIMVTPVIHGLKSIQIKDIPATTNILILGGGCHHDGNSSAEQLSSPSLKRLLEGYRLWKQVPGSELILSGIDWQRQCNIAEIESDLIYLWNNDTTKVLKLNPAMNTREEAKLYFNKFGKQKPIVLVSSALHLPRAIRNFNKLGVKVIAAPVDFPLSQMKLNWIDIFPSPDCFQASKNAWIEWIAWLFNI